MRSDGYRLSQPIRATMESNLCAMDEMDDLYTDTALGLIYIQISVPQQGCMLEAISGPLADVEGQDPSSNTHFPSLEPCEPGSTDTDRLGSRSKLRRLAKAPSNLP